MVINSDQYYDQYIMIQSSTWVKKEHNNFQRWLWQGGTGEDTVSVVKLFH